MLFVPFKAPEGYRWIVVREYFDPINNITVRARDHHRDAFCLLVSAGSTVA